MDADVAQLLIICFPPLQPEFETRDRQWLDMKIYNNGVNPFELLALVEQCIFFLAFKSKKMMTSPLHIVTSAS